MTLRGNFKPNCGYAKTLFTNRKVRLSCCSIFFMSPSLTKPSNQPFIPFCTHYCNSFERPVYKLLEKPFAILHSIVLRNAVSMSYLRFLLLPFQSMRPKARVLVQYGSLPDRLEESDPAGCDFAGICPDWPHHLSLCVGLICY
jgi:hypothetical protein